MRRLAQSTAYTVMLKLFLSSDHVTAATGKTVAIKLSKAGGAFGDPNAGASNATEVASGWYKFALDTTDTNTLGDLVVRGTASSCDDAEQICIIVSATTGGATNLDIATSALLTTQMTESYAADGVAPTLAQILFLIQQFQQEKNISSTTMTVKKLDGSTTAATFTLDSATAPASITRAT